MSTFSGLVLATLLMSGADAVDPALLCHAGAYRLADGTYLDVMPSDPEKLRWRMFDGKSGLLASNPDGQWTSTIGWTGRSDGITVQFGNCAEGRIEFGARTGRKLAFGIVDTKFEGAGETLRGRLILPQGSAAVPVAVLVHGSESYSAVERNHRQPARFLRSPSPARPSRGEGEGRVACGKESFSPIGAE